MSSTQAARRTPVFSARVVLSGGRLLEAMIEGGRAYRLRWGLPGAWRVAYAPGERVVDGRRRPYAFRSVEQLRYDFECDVEHAQAADRDGR